MLERNEKENFFRVCLVGWRGKKNKSWDSDVFSSAPLKFFSQNREKIEGRKFDYLMDEIVHVHLHIEQK